MDFSIKAFIRFIFTVMMSPIWIIMWPMLFVTTSSFELLLWAFGWNKDEGEDEFYFTSGLIRFIKDDFINNLFFIKGE